jgi:HD-GYP domain-containing protein (c-di-GMP phosphodiesterase class II)
MKVIDQALAGIAGQPPRETAAPSAPPEPPSTPVNVLGLAARCYIAIVVLLATASVVVFARELTTAGWPGLVTLIILGIILERAGIRIYGDTYVSAGVVALFAIAVLYDAPGVAVAAPILVLGARVFTYARWYQTVFDMGSYTLASVSAALIFHAMPGVGETASAWWIPAAVLATAVNYAISSGLVATAVSLSTGEPPLGVWRDQHQWILPYYVVFGCLSLALAAAYQALQVPGILAFVAPPFMMRFALQQYVSKTEQTVLQLKQKNAELESANDSIMAMTRTLTETYDGTLEALVLALDARDHETKGHSFRVAQYVMAMAVHLDVEEQSQEWVDMQRGALLHDVGKIGVPDYILHKPGPLTPEEWNDMKRHPRIGHEMLRDISFLAGAAEIVHCHHERFDGKGYPRGLGGNQVPLGARVFAVADAFDAMTSDRPYRKALPPEMAREEVIRHSGTQFDPDVVQAFLLVYDQITQKALHDREGEHARAA